MCIDIFGIFILCRDNYLQLDLYYREIKYENIIQQPMFSYSSLLSEVGAIFFYCVSLSWFNITGNNMTEFMYIVGIMHMLISHATHACK